MSLDAIGIIAKDPKQTIQFYELLGVKLIEAGGADHFEAKTPSGVRIMVDSETLIKKINPDWTKTPGGGVVLCFKQETPAQVDQAYTSVVEAGFKSVKEPWDAFWGQRYSSVSDPDGNQIDLFAALE